MDKFASQRKMLLEILQQKGIQDQRVLDTLTHVPRERFVDRSLQHRAYENCPLPLSQGQTISQPFIVALMTQALALSGHERVLEIGTGSGYQTAILSQLSSWVYSVERHASLSAQAEKRLARCQCRNVLLSVGDGSLGWSEHAPYDRIIVTAAAPRVPSSLVEQLELGGLLVIPVGEPQSQELLVVQRVLDGPKTHSLGLCVFVPLVGEDAWRENMPTF
jgi:protein-L-isoaspartate(D-aspartate) O-methyltransferase